MKIVLRKFDPRLGKIGLAILGTNLAWSLSRFSLNTVFLDQYVNYIWTAHRFGSPKQLNPKLYSLSAQVVEDLKLGHKLDKINFFPSAREIVYFGIYKLRKIFIGLPFYFEYRNLNQIDKDKIVFFDGQAPNWNNEDGKLYMQSLVLSDNAKKFAIAEQIVIGTSWENFIRCLNPLASALFSAIALLRTDILLNRVYPKLSPKKRFILSLLLSLCIYLTFFLSNRVNADFCSNEKIDKLLEDMRHNKEYIEGGLEYYLKLQKKNKCFRNFLGDQGKNYIKSNGDFVIWFSKKYTVTEMIQKLSMI